MTELKVGQKYIMNSTGCASVEVGEIVEITKVTKDGTYPYYKGVKNGGYCSGHVSDLEPVTVEGEKKVAKRTFKLLKDLPDAKKGALFQEMCEDGTQPYACITTDLLKHDARNSEYPSRNAVEGEPGYFIEVFQVEPQYMTRAELDQYEAFKQSLVKSRKKPATKKKVTSKTVKKVTK